MAANKRQHFVPQTYLRLWAANQVKHNDHQVYLFRRNGAPLGLRHPKQMMWRPDLYSVRNPLTGKKGYPIDDGLRQFETIFGTLKSKIETFQSFDDVAKLTNDDIGKLCASVYIQAARSPYRSIYAPAVWERAVRDAGFVRDAYRPNAFRETLCALVESEGRYESSMSSYVVRRIASKPIAFLPLAVAHRISKVMQHADLYFYQPPIGALFITSDNPCLSSRDGFVVTRRSGVSEGNSAFEEFFMPLAPNLATLITPSVGLRRRLGFGKLDDDKIETLNKLVIAQSRELIVNREASLPAKLFEPPYVRQVVFPLDDVTIRPRP